MDDGQTDICDSRVAFATKKKETPVNNEQYQVSRLWESSSRKEHQETVGCQEDSQQVEETFGICFFRDKPVKSTMQWAQMKQKHLWTKLFIRSKI